MDLLPVISNENAVKRAMVPFLKEFYRYRYEPTAGSEIATLDNVSSDGLVADILLRFRKPDNSLFVCACEATGLGREDEVRYTLNRAYFMWDCAAFATLITTILYTIFYVFQRKWLVSLGWSGNAGLIFGLAIFSFFSWYFLMSGWRKYRYIMAIEQFKQYFADEQWVAVAEEVFPAPNDPYLLELRRQCVYNGFGLAVVSIVGTPRALVNPSRIGIYGKDRKMADWITQTSLYKGAYKGFSVISKIRPEVPAAGRILWNRISRPVQENLISPIQTAVRNQFSRPWRQARSQFDRFMTGRRTQKWLIALSLVVLVPLVVRVLQTKVETVADLTAYLTPRVRRVENYPTNPPYDNGPVKYGELKNNGGIPRQYFEPSRPLPDPVPTSPSAAYVPTEKVPPPRNRPQQAGEEVPTIDMSRNRTDVPTIDMSRNQSEVPTINLSDDSDPEKKPAAKTSPDKPASRPAETKRPLRNSRCAGLSRSQGWVIQDNAFSTQLYADARVGKLLQQDISALTVAGSCVQKDLEGFVVLLGDVLPDEAQARKEAEVFKKALRKAGLGNGKFLIRKLE